MSRTWLRLALLAGGLSGGSAVAEPPALTPDQVWIHDPVIAATATGYVLFSTGPGIKTFRSADLQHWQPGAVVFDPPPPWAKRVAPGFDGHIWAPDISFHDGRWYLYYSISAFGKNTSAIGVATNPTLDPENAAFHWTDHGVVVQSVPDRDLFNAIDPNLVEDVDGSPWLAFGSFWGGLKLVKLGPDRTRPAEPQQWHTLAKRARDGFVDDADPGPAAIEAPYLLRHDGYWILFMSWDHCCRGTASDYKIVVGRARTLQGPYLDRDGQRLDQGGGSLLLEGTPRWPGTGHNSVLEADGRAYLVFHAYDPQDDDKSKLQLLPLGWDADGWPVVDASPLR